MDVIKESDIPFKTKVSVVRKYHNHILQINPWHRHEKKKPIKLTGKQDIMKTIKVKQPALSLSLSLSLSSRWLKT